jgi:hypothetical protein
MNLKRSYRRLVKRHRNDDHAMATVGRLVMGAAAVVAGLFIIRSIPDLVRYVKFERM